MYKLIAIVLMLVSVAASAPPASVPNGPSTLAVDGVVVYKARHELVLLSGGREVRRYRVALGPMPIGRKVRRGDGRTPEGVYVLDYRNPNSHYYRSIHISYPNAEDRAAARMRGFDPGGDVFIHGLPNGEGSVGAAHLERDWTLGCIAVTNSEIDEIWSLVQDGTKIEILP